MTGRAGIPFVLFLLMECYIVEKETINLRTGEPRWVPYVNPPADTCPSCCDPAGKLISRRVVKLVDCQTPFLAPDGRNYQHRIERVYADGNCGSRIEYSYEKLCSGLTVPIKMIAIGGSGACRLKLEIVRGNETSYHELSNTLSTYTYQVGDYTLRAIQEGCTGTVKLRLLAANNGPGAVIWQQGEAPKLVTFTEATTGFYIELIP